MSENLPAHVKYELPKIEDLYEEKELQLASKLNDLNKILNSRPSPKWIKAHPIATKKIRVGTELREVPVDFIPIGIIEYLLTRIYIKWWPEILKSEVMANSVVITIRLHVLNPVTMEWDTYDGIGAAPIRTKKGATAMDVLQTQDSAIQTAAPAAKSYAIKDAAECIGKIFGKDINRNDEMNYEPMQEAKFREKPTELTDGLRAAIRHSDGSNLGDIYKAHAEYHDIPELMQLINARKTELRNKQQQ